MLTGQRHGALNVLNDNFDIQMPDPVDRSAWVDFALLNNFSLQAARYREEAARQTAKANRSEHLPKIIGSFDYTESDTKGSQSNTFNAQPAPIEIDNDPFQEVEDEVWGVAVTLPLYTGGALSANRRRAAQEYNAALQDRVNLTRNTVTNTRSLHMTVVSDVTRVAARKQSIVSSRSALDATQAGYEVGTRNVVDVLNAQN